MPAAARHSWPGDAPQLSSATRLLPASSAVRHLTSTNPRMGYNGSRWAGPFPGLTAIQSTMTPAAAALTPTSDSGGPIPKTPAGRCQAKIASTQATGPAITAPYPPMGSGHVPDIGPLVRPVSTPILDNSPEKSGEIRKRAPRPILPPAGPPAIPRPSPDAANTKRPPAPDTPGRVIFKFTPHPAATANTIHPHRRGNTKVASNDIDTHNSSAVSGRTKKVCIDDFM